MSGKETVGLKAWMSNETVNELGQRQILSRNGVHVSQIFDEMFGHWLEIETRFLLRRYTRIYIIILACIQTKQYLRLQRRRRQPSLLPFLTSFPQQI